MTVIAGSPTISTDSPPPVIGAGMEVQLHRLTQTTEQVAEQRDQARRDVLEVLGHLGDANKALWEITHEWVHEQVRADKADALTCALGTELGRARAEAGLLRRVADRWRAQCGEQAAENRVLRGRLEAALERATNLERQVVAQRREIERLTRRRPLRLRRRRW